MKTTFIYALNDPRTGLMRYIGKSDNPQARWAAHISGEKSNDHRCRWIHSLLRQGLKPELQILMEIPQEGWQEIEKRFIQVFRSAGMNLVNIAEGGEGSQGAKHSLETRKKISVASSGRRPSLETRLRLRECNLGHSVSEETRKKISIGNLGKVISPEHRAKISAFHKGRKRSPETCARIALINKGRTFSAEIRGRMSEAHRGPRPWRIGVGHTLAARQRMSEAQKSIARQEEYKNPFLGRAHSLETREKMKAAWRLRKQKILYGNSTI